jgi:hypothetical protein
MKIFYFLGLIEIIFDYNTHLTTEERSILTYHVVVISVCQDNLW